MPPGFLRPEGLTSPGGCGSDFVGAGRPSGALCRHKRPVRAEISLVGSTRPAILHYPDAAANLQAHPEFKGTEIRVGLFWMQTESLSVFWLRAMARSVKRSRQSHFPVFLPGMQHADAFAARGQTVGSVQIHSVAGDIQRNPPHPLVDKIDGIALPQAINSFLIRPVQLFGNGGCLIGPNSF